MIEALDKVTPGIASDETLLYGVEVKFYSNKVVVDKDFETSIKGLRAIGDGAGAQGACSRPPPTASAWQEAFYRVWEIRNE